MASHYYLIDLENVGIKALRGIEFTEESEEVVIFISAAAHVATTELRNDIIKSKAVISTFYCGSSCKNGKDFEIAACFGEIIKIPDAQRISIISGDNGFKSLQDYAGRVRKSVAVYQAPSVMEAFIAAKVGYTTKEYTVTKNNNIDFKHIMDELRTAESFRNELCAITGEGNTAAVSELLKSSKSDLRKLYIGLLHLLGKEKGLKAYRYIKSQGYPELLLK